jgi:hypothetical protein
MLLQRTEKHDRALLREQALAHPDEPIRESPELGKHGRA